MRLLRPRPTAQSVISQTEAYVACCGERDPRGPNGEAGIAVVLHTRDAGAHWGQIPWRRSVWCRLRHPGFPTWPPETVVDLERTREGLRIVHRDEWVPFEPGGESLWHSTLVRGRWRSRRLRAMDYEGSDRPAPPHIELELPSGMRPPPTVASIVVVPYR